MTSVVVGEWYIGKKLFICVCDRVFLFMPKRLLAHMIYPQQGTEGSPKHAFTRRATERHQTAQEQRKGERTHCVAPKHS